MKKNNWLTGSVVTITLLNAVFPAMSISAEMNLDSDVLNETKSATKKNSLNLKSETYLNKLKMYNEKKIKYEEKIADI